MGRIRQHFRARGMFWRVYFHGIGILVIIALTLAALTLGLSSRPVWQQAPRLMTDSLVDAWQVDLASSSTPSWQSPTLTARVKELATFLHVRIAVYRLPDHHLEASSHERPPPPLTEAGVARLGRGESWVREAHFQGNALSLQVPGGPSAYVVLDHGWEQPLWKTPPYNGLLILMGMLLTLALVSVPQARSIVAPLERLTRSVKAFGRGDLSVRVGTQCSGEVGELAAAFDDMASRLEQLIRSEKELLANVSHELRTPLARIRFALELAEGGDTVEARRYLTEIRSDLQELERLVEDVLTSTRLDLAGSKAGQGSPPLRLELLDLTALVEQAADRFERMAPERKLQMVLEADVPLIEGDGTLLRRVVDNLLDNARKYADPDAPILLQARGEEKKGIIEVTDQGAGIDAADLPHVFEPFFRTDRSRSRDSGGVGLGLALARRVIEAHGGRITAQSGGGKTTFRLELPGRESPGP